MDFLEQKKFKMLLFAFFVQFCTAVRYRDCGTTGITIKQVLVTPCPTEPCELIHGQTYSIEVDFEEQVWKFIILMFLREFSGLFFTFLFIFFYIFFIYFFTFFVYFFFTFFYSFLHLFSHFWTFFSDFFGYKTERPMIFFVFLEEPAKSWVVQLYWQWCKSKTKLYIDFRHAKVWSMWSNWTSLCSLSSWRSRHSR